VFLLLRQAVDMLGVLVCSRAAQRIEADTRRLQAV